MKSSFIVGLLFAVGSAVAQDIDLTALMGQLGNPSEACQAEVQKYQSCVTGKASSSEEVTTEKVKAFCSSFDENTCKDFLDDITKSDSACLNTEQVNVADLLTDMEVITVKLQYQILCAKDEKGNVCPLSQYLTDNVAKLEDNNQTTLTDDQKKIIANDCKSSKCHDRMIALKEYIDKITTIATSMGASMSDMSSGGSVLSSNSTTTIFNDYYPFYKDNKCGSIDGSSDKSDSSDASTLKKITYAFVTMMALSVFMLL
jgi:hypothetical protein